MTGRASRLALCLLVPLAGCVYFNAMWRAEQFAKEARRLEAHGRAGEARLWWARASEKAESVLVRHPTSRWADDALVLQGEALARSGDCAGAREPLEAARATVTDVALRERATLAALECALARGDGRNGAALAAEVVDSRDARRRARAAYLGGRAAEARGDRVGAIELYARSTLVSAQEARVRLLLELGRVEEAQAEVPRLARRSRNGETCSALLAELARVATVQSATRALDAALGTARWSTGQRARLLIEDGDRLRAAGDSAGAGRRYEAAAAEALDSVEAGVARARQLRLRAAGLTSPAGAGELVETAQRLAISAVGPRGVEEARAVERLLAPVADSPSGVVAALRAAELARDSLHARALAARLFLHVAAEHPQSIFAPKALVAALALDPPERDSITQVLAETYGASPYTRALYGQPSPAYRATEDSLAVALGLTSGPLAAAVAPRWAAPVPGPRGPALEPILPSPASAPPPHAPRTPRDGRPS